ncbi:hypothetical protein KCP70_00340 [Salmonella enterica subsp. enterica]|nr:hypothetical protein KCP70_00340 [Salmonella enterica subsp. enterica]
MASAVRQRRPRLLISSVTCYRQRAVPATAAGQSDWLPDRQHQSTRRRRGCVEQVTLRR